ncbi:hypothetical protein H6G80_24145 [Nostoc sp. FACHB-87]|nr:hypothetical protein [Nostoc sp. FACHB-190]MBD2457153.1 hypothetical protein [Nostoc sp. FACHB-87]MBD2476981.1 hypothetical protein [Anabaena sp. FACHB-83]MBD2490577.1 hypothetical protein [Aulosira sp. FACHB-615]
MMKRILAGALLALPLSIFAVENQASAAPVIIKRDNYRTVVVRKPAARKPVVVRKVVRQRWVPAHWERTPRGRRWVTGRYERY